MDYKLTLTKQELDNLINACYAQIQGYCVGLEEEKPFKELLDKLVTISQEK